MAYEEDLALALKSVVAELKKARQALADLVAAAEQYLPMEKAITDKVKVFVESLGEKTEGKLPALASAVERARKVMKEE